MNVNLRYPILMVHGMGFRDSNLVGYWGRIPVALEQIGCKLFYGNQDSNATVEENGKRLAERIEEILKETGSEKINIIAHSKGGLDSRYAISTLKTGDKIASLTTISTPHHGSLTIDKLLKVPNCLIKFGCFFVDMWFRLLGDKKPHTYSVIQSFTTSEAKRFNEENPDHLGVYYQSYAFVMKKPSSDMLMFMTNLVISKVEGKNDGLLTPDAVKWGNFKGVFCGAGKRGISHFDEVDFRRKSLSKISGDGINDIVDLYRNIVVDLKNLGF